MLRPGWQRSRGAEKESWEDAGSLFGGPRQDDRPDSVHWHSANRMQGSTQAQPIVVGIALKKEKRKKHISDKLVTKAAEAGITIRFVDKERELEAQGPFVAILQKVRKPGEYRCACRTRGARCRGCQLAAGTGGWALPLPAVGHGQPPARSPHAAVAPACVPAREPPPRCSA